MKLNKLIIAISLLNAILFTSCSEDEKGQDNSAPIRFNASNNTYIAATPNSTRTSETVFNVGDQIGVYMVYAGEFLLEEGNYATNQLYVAQENGVLTADFPIRWSGSALNFFAYYPYSPTPIPDVRRYAFTANQDQSTPEAYAKSDFMAASNLNVGVTGESVPLVFEHKLAKIVVNIVKGNADVDLSKAKVKILGTINKATVNLVTGGTTIVNGTSSARNIIACNKGGNVHEAITIAQKVNANVFGLEIGIGNDLYAWTSVRPIELTQGKQLSFTASINDSALPVLTVKLNSQITDWDDDGTISAPTKPGTASPTKYDQTKWSVKSVSSVNEGVGSANGFPTQGFARNLIDDNYASSYYASWSAPLPHHFVLDMKESLNIDGFIIYTGHEQLNQLKDAELLISNDGETWNSLGDYVIGKGSTIINTKTDCTLQKTETARYFKMIMKSSWGPNTGFLISEIEAYKKN